MNNIQLLIDSAAGIYIPKEFIERSMDVKGWDYGVDQNEIDAILRGPDEEWYLDAWINLCANAVFTDPEGGKWTLFHDGDLFLIPEGFDTEAWRNGELDV